MFIGRTDVEAETPILWPPDVKNWLIRKDPNAGKDWRQEEKGMTEDEMAGWHHQLNEYEFEQALGVGDGQGSLVSCSPWGCKESDTTEWLTHSLHFLIFYIYFWYCIQWLSIMCSVSSVQSLSRVQLFVKDSVDCSTPGLPVLHQLLELGQTHIQRVGDAIQPSHPLSSPSPPALSLSQHQGLFQWVSSSHLVAKVLEFQLQHQSFQWIFRTDFL